MTSKILLSTILIIFCGISEANAEVTLKEIRSASNDVLVVFFTGDSADAS